MSPPDPGGAVTVHERYENTAYIVICRDGPDGAARRAAHTRAHLAYIDSVLDSLNVAGPLYDESGVHPVGSIFCVRTTELAKARSLIENDPYFKGGVFVSVEYFPYLPAAGKWIGGTVW